MEKIEKEFIGGDSDLIIGFIQLFLEGKINDDKKFWYIDINFDVNSYGEDFHLIANFFEIIDNNNGLGRDNLISLGGELNYYFDYNEKIDFQTYDLGIGNKLYNLMGEKLKKYYQEEEGIKEEGIKIDNHYEFYCDD